MTKIAIVLLAWTAVVISITADCIAVVEFTWKIIEAVRSRSSKKPNSFELTEFKIPNILI